MIELDLCEEGGAVVVDISELTPLNTMLPPGGRQSILHSVVNSPCCSCITLLLVW